MPRRKEDLKYKGIAPRPFAYSERTNGLTGKEEGVHEQIRRRCVRLGNLLIETGLTVRALAKATGYSKSTVHKDLTERLPNIDAHLSEEVAKVLAYHKSIRHLRGGEATRQKWKIEQRKLNETAATETD